MNKCEHPTMLKAKIANKDKDVELDNSLLPYCCLTCGELFLIHHISLKDNPEFAQILKDGVQEWKKHIPHI